MEVEKLIVSGFRNFSDATINFNGRTLVTVLRHAYSRYFAVKPEIESSPLSRGGFIRQLAEEDIFCKAAIFLKPEVQFDHVVNLPNSEDRTPAVVCAMITLEDYRESQKGVLTETRYQELKKDVQGNLLQTPNNSTTNRLEVVVDREFLRNTKTLDSLESPFCQLH